VGDAFGSLIAPLSTSAFFERFFERDVLHVARGDASYFAGLYGVGCIEDALVTGANELDHFAMIKRDAPELSGERIASDRNVVRFRSGGKPARALLDPRRVLAAFADGYTLNIKDAGAFLPALAQYCNRMQVELGFYAQANAYFTPPQSQGFALHYDVHDTLIVQIEGPKEWQVYEPVVPLPLELQPFSASMHEGKLGAPRTYALAAGDSLYVPHGYPHFATAGAERSLHLTFALSPIRASDLLASLVDLAALGDVDLRRALPPGWHRDPAFPAQFAAQLAALIPRALATERIPLAAELADNELYSASRTMAAGAFDALAAVDALGPQTQIRLRDDAPMQIRDRATRLDIILASKVVAVPAAARAALTRLQTGPATYAELEPLLPPGVGPAFVRTLVVEGLALIGPSTAR
jgi:lysine-specific demethylase/histidyl-hydroxylase NO66